MNSLELGKPFHTVYIVLSIYFVLTTHDFKSAHIKMLFVFDRNKSLNKTIAVLGLDWIRYNYQ